ncbi:AmmeMemoRadiSam system radical SAM enzyme [Nigerium massiliense]|uniref:AmmeMemoRadiSam system radical SAM enzyme n=1 Tax=Nigerium massiliense TaxID=1522317 RepID=UPI00058E4AFC|nr:AmmeMemoRadiSam system radical SAM enzyme [Nigerium massiliense]
MGADVIEGRPANYWKPLPDGRIECDLCPRECRLRDGQRGFCFVRANKDGRLVLTTDGRSSGFCIDPIEKKPLAHFHPGTSVLSFGTAGCNLGCKFCQNWDISKSREMDRLQDQASATQIADAALAHGCRSVAYTYNDPLIFTEYAIDVAQACRERDILNVGVTAGYVNPEARRDFFGAMDAANIDLKAFTDDFYRRITGARLRPVLDTLVYLRQHTDVWFELTTLIIPGHNDSDGELRAMTSWIVAELGPDVPLHFSAFHPDHRMRDVPPTPPATLTRARQIALDAGVRYAYTGNVHDVAGDTTFCPGCHRALIVRDWYALKGFHLDVAGEAGSCPSCGAAVAGRFDPKPGRFGPRRLPIRLGR